ncbi:hypothetical protein OAO87_03395 [bacterium]|nr:hypothetical protein [bacterium]
MRMLALDENEANAADGVHIYDHSLHGGGVVGPTPHLRSLCRSLQDARSCQRLIHLELRDCALDDGSATLLSTTLVCSHLELQTINLGRNSIGTAGTMSLSEVTSRMPSLQLLNIDQQCYRTLEEWTKTKRGKEKVVRRWRRTGRMKISTKAIRSLIRAVHGHQQPIRITLENVGIDLTTVTSSDLNYKNLFEVQVIFSRMGPLPSGIVADHLGQVGWLYHATNALRMYNFDIIPVDEDDSD